MSEKIFKQVDKGDGAYEYVEVTAAELPEEIVKDHPQYKTVLKESIDRRKVIQDLKKAVVTNEDETAIVQETSPAKEVVTASASVDKEALYEEFRTRLLGETTVETKADKTAREQRETLVTQAMSDNGLSSPELREIIVNSPDPKKTAELLAKSGYRFDDVLGGEVLDIKASKPVNEAIASLKKRFQD